MKPTSGVTVTRFRYTVALGALLALAGCGGHGGADASASSSANAQDSMVKFAQCMRQHGVEVEDPRSGESGVRIKSRLNERQTEAAMQACRKYSPKGDIDPNDPKVRDQMLKMAQCLRRHGVQIDDPQPGQGLRVRTRKGDTKTQQAMEACEKLVPRPGSSGTPASGG
jgi:hypothetical protein